MGLMVDAALAAGRHDLAQDVLQPMVDYLQAQGLTKELTGWIDRCLDALESADGSAPDLDSDAGALWLFVKGQSAMLAGKAHDLDRAEATLCDILESLKAAAASEQNDPRFAVVFHNLVHKIPHLVPWA